MHASCLVYPNPPKMIIVKKTSAMVPACCLWPRPLQLIPLPLVMALRPPPPLPPTIRDRASAPVAPVSRGRAGRAGADSRLSVRRTRRRPSPLCPSSPELRRPTSGLVLATGTEPGPTSGWSVMRSYMSSGAPPPPPPPPPPPAATSSATSAAAAARPPAEEDLCAPGCNSAQSGAGAGAHLAAKVAGEAAPPHRCVEHEHLAPYCRKTRRGTHPRRHAPRPRKKNGMHAILVRSSFLALPAPPLVVEAVCAAAPGTVTTAVCSRCS